VFNPKITTRGHYNLSTKPLEVSYFLTGSSLELLVATGIHRRKNSDAPPKQPFAYPLAFLEHTQTP
jgi:hypothetical protein